MRFQSESIELYGGRGRFVSPTTLYKFFNINRYFSNSRFQFRSYSICIKLLGRNALGLIRLISSIIHTITTHTHNDFYEKPLQLKILTNKNDFVEHMRFITLHFSDNMNDVLSQSMPKLLQSGNWILNTCNNYGTIKVPAQNHWR